MNGIFPECGKGERGTSDRQKNTLGKRGLSPLRERAGVKGACGQKSAQERAKRHNGECGKKTWEIVWNEAGLTVGVVRVQVEWYEYGLRGVRGKEKGVKIAVRRGARRGQKVVERGIEWGGKKSVGRQRNGRRYKYGREGVVRKGGGKNARRDAINRDNGGKVKKGEGNKSMSCGTGSKKKWGGWMVEKMGKNEWGVGKRKRNS